MVYKEQGMFGTGARCSHCSRNKNKGCLAREQDAPTAVYRNKNNGMHHY
ncbi:hypothetical protein [Okeania sp. KiyG1]|nr:hypothetical protein [Okeania sp. KiyG1]